MALPPRPLSPSSSSSFSFHSRRRSILQERAQTLLSILHAFSPHKLTPSCRSRLARLLSAELCFLSRLSSHRCSPLLALKLRSTNLCYLEAVIEVLQHPFVDGASSVLQNFPVAPCEGSADIEAHVDIVCTFKCKPVWFVVSGRNPKHIHWLDHGHCKGLKSKLSFLIRAAVANLLLQPTAIIFCFAKGVSDAVAERLQSEHGAHRIGGLEWKMEMQSGDKSLQISQEVEEGEWIKLWMDAGSFSLDGPSETFEEVEEGEWINVFKNSFSFDGFAMETEKVKSQNQVPVNSCNSTCLVDQWAVFQIEKECFHLGSNDFKLVDTVNKEKHLSMEFCISGHDAFLGRNYEENFNLDVSSHMSASCFNSLTLPYGPSEGASNFNSLIEFLKCHKRQLQQKKLSTSQPDLINLDTTAMIALVSEVSNGQAQNIFNMPNEELRQMFRNTSDFMKDQAKLELEKPLLWEIMLAISHRRPFISQFVCDEFKSLVSICGSSGEKQRANDLLQLLMVLPNRPSIRMMSLCESGRIKEKNKTIFGTGDSWNAPTLTSNMSFVRAARQTGMALSVIEHRPCALVGDKCH